MTNEEKLKWIQKYRKDKKFREYIDFIVLIDSYERLGKNIKKKIDDFVWKYNLVDDIGEYLQESTDKGGYSEFFDLKMRDIRDILINVLDKSFPYDIDEIYEVFHWEGLEELVEEGRTGM